MKTKNSIQLKILILESQQMKTKNAFRQSEHSHWFSADTDLLNDILRSRNFIYNAIIGRYQKVLYMNYEAGYYALNREMF